MPRRRPGAAKKSDYDLKDHLLFLVEGMDQGRYGVIDNFISYEQLEDCWNENRSYLMNLFFYGDEGGSLGGYDAGYRPAGWWYAESPIKQYIRDGKHSGVVGDNAYLDGQYYKELKKYAVKDKYRKPDPFQFKINQYLFLKDHNLLYDWEKKEIKKEGLKPDWITRQADKI